MACNCNKEKKESEDCPEGQTFDVSQGKCVAKSEKKENAFGDPKTDEVQADVSGSGADVGGQASEVSARECPEGHTWDDASEVCVPTSPDKTDDIGDTKANIATEKAPKWATELSKKLDKLNEKKPIAQVAKTNNNEELDFKQIAERMIKRLSDGDSFRFNIPLQEMRSRIVKTVRDPNTGRLEERFTGAYQPGNGQLQEAVSLSGTHATQDLDTDVAIVPGGISFKPVFQFAKTKMVGEGMDRARFFKTTIPANGSQTVGSTPSEATQTITSVEVTPSTITGVYLIGDFDEIENSPFDLLQSIVEASAASYEDFVATDMLDTVSAEGTLTAGLWIRGDTGATVTTSDTASVAFDETGVFVAREYLENQGYLRGGIKPVLFLDPQQWRELVTSTNVTSLATRSAPDVWVKAELEQFAGVQLVVTNAVEHKSDQTNAAINAIMCVPKHSYGIAIKRDVTVKMHEIGEDNQVRINTTWRTKTGVIDSSSIVRISTTD